MRLITGEALLAFKTGRKFKQGNTEVKIVDGKPEMYLFGNKIAWIGNNNRLYWTMAGYPTVTTKERLSALLRGKLYQRNYTQYYWRSDMGSGAMEISPHEVYVEDFR